MLPAYNPIQYVAPPANLLPTLTVSSKGRAYLSLAIRERLNLRANQPIDLFPPTQDTPFWHLDMRPNAARRLAWYPDTRPRIQHLKFAAEVFGEQSKILLQLLPGEPIYPGAPGIIPLMLSAQPTEAPAPPLAATPC